MQKRVQRPSNSSNESHHKKIKKDTSHESVDDDDENEDIVENTLVTANVSPLNQKETIEEPVVGIIRRITVCNFMCHNHLDVSLGTHVNFIIGRNGSGKSAIVTALVVGLGGKATVTSRGSSIKNFVKIGKRSAWVEITLNNRGPDSYKHNIYGDKIIIKRKFSAEGASSYAINSATGQPISNKREELQHILDHLNIQVDNPVSILNQDTSRNFLNTRSASDKFKFFMKATQLEQMSSDYEQVNRNKEETRIVINSKDQALADMKKEVQVWKNKFKNVMALTDLKDKIKLLQKELAWSFIAEKEKGLKPLEKILLAEEAALPRFLKKVEESKTQQEEWEKRMKELEQQLIDSAKEVRALEPLLQQKKKDLDEEKEKLMPITNQLKSIEREITSLGQDCRQCQVRINELKAESSRDYEAEKLQRVEQINKIRARLQELESKKKVLEHEIDLYRNAVIKYKSECSNFQSNFTAKQAQLKNISVTKQRFIAAKNNRLKRFGDWMPEVINAISSKKSQFHQLPKGPLGASFDLVDHKWALAVECCLKGLVSAFVCHDLHDAKLLEEIFNKCPQSRAARPVIITCAFSNCIYDVSQNRVVSRDYPCILDVIRCDDPVVMNTLIDQRRIENVLLISNSNEAREVMLRSPPLKASECFTENGDQVFCSPTFRFYSNNKSNVRYLMSDVQEQILKIEQEEKLLEEDKIKICQQIGKSQQQVTQNQAEENKCKARLIDISKTLSSLSSKVNELQTEDDDDVPVDVKTLEEEVVVYEEKIQELKARREQLIEEKKIHDTNFDSLKKSYCQLEANIRQKSDNGIPLREEISQAQNELEKVRTAVKHYALKLKEQQKKIHEEKQKVEKHKADFEQERKKALQFCEPVRATRSSNSINSEINQIKTRIEEQEEEQGNEAEITLTYKEKNDALEKIKKEVGQLQRYLNKLDEVMDRRNIAYQRMRKLIANRAKYYFLLQMSQRSFTGKMNFDFQKETLEILVSTSQQDSKDKSSSEVKDLKSLSGGERSFSTVCFILSLWEAMESPFRCLDEFDVFMDMVNRRISMDMMMATADMHKNQQFIFLTPQDMSSVRNISNVKIYRMQDPERNQQVLNVLPNSQQKSSQDVI